MSSCTPTCSRSSTKASPERLQIRQIERQRRLPLNRLHRAATVLVSPTGADSHRTGVRKTRVRVSTNYNRRDSCVTDSDGSAESAGVKVGRAQNILTRKRSCHFSLLTSAFFRKHEATRRKVPGVNSYREAFSGFPSAAEPLQPFCSN